MAVSFRQAGTANASGVAPASVSVTTGSLIQSRAEADATDDCTVIVTVQKPFSSTLGDLTGWTKVKEGVSGSTANGADSGSVRVGVFVKVGAASSAVVALGALFGGTTDTATAAISTWQNATGIWDYGMIQEAIDNAYAANFSATAAAGLDLLTGDALIGCVALNSDNGSPTAIAITGLTGATLSGLQTRSNANTNTGNDSRCSLPEVFITAGSSNLAPTYSYTNASSTAGIVEFLRLREMNVISASGSGVGSGTINFIPNAVGTASGDGAGSATIVPNFTLSGTSQGNGIVSFVVPLSVSGTGPSSGSVTFSPAFSGTGSGDGSGSITISSGHILAGSGAGSGVVAFSPNLTLSGSGSGSGTGTAIPYSVLLGTGDGTGALNTFVPQLSLSGASEGQGIVNFMVPTAGSGSGNGSGVATFVPQFNIAGDSEGEGNAVLSNDSDIIGTGGGNGAGTATITSTTHAITAAGSGGGSGVIGLVPNIAVGGSSLGSGSGQVVPGILAPGTSVGNGSIVFVVNLLTAGDSIGTGTGTAVEPPTEVNFTISIGHPVEELGMSIGMPVPEETLSIGGWV